VWPLWSKLLFSAEVFWSVLMASYCAYPIDAARPRSAKGRKERGRERRGRVTRRVQAWCHCSFLQGGFPPSSPQPPLCGWSVNKKKKKGKKKKNRPAGSTVSGSNTPRPIPCRKAPPRRSPGLQEQKGKRKEGEEDPRISSPTAGERASFHNVHAGTPLLPRAPTTERERGRRGKKKGGGVVLLTAASETVFVSPPSTPRFVETKKKKREKDGEASEFEVCLLTELLVHLHRQSQTARKKRRKKGGRGNVLRPSS